MAKSSGKKTKKGKLPKAYKAMRKDLMKTLQGVDTNILISVVQQPQRPGDADFFSDWPDTYNRDSWYKTWAKAEAFTPQLASKAPKKG